MKKGEKMKRVMIAISVACWRRALAATDNIVKQLHVDAQAHKRGVADPGGGGHVWLLAASGGL